MANSSAGTAALTTAADVQPEIPTSLQHHVSDRAETLACPEQGTEVSSQPPTLVQAQPSCLTVPVAYSAPPLVTSLSSPTISMALPSLSTGAAVDARIGVSRDPLRQQQQWAPLESSSASPRPYVVTQGSPRFQPWQRPTPLDTSLSSPVSPNQRTPCLMRQMLCMQQQADDLDEAARRSARTSPVP